MEKLINELKVKLLEILNLVDIRPEDIGEDDQLVGGDLGIDSIDILEMVIMIDKDYGVLIDNRTVGEEVLQSLRTLARYIYENSTRL
ncbi:Acyl carrier protein (fragment) [uncultured Desulfobacterium sp.]|uniref:Acyl carrier protein n=1 Tax=uncultured Desulfobacterium sp. TaxID=201089 RepID=A0A445MZF7_9BACT